MSSLMIAAFFIIAMCLVTVSYMVGEIVGAKKTTKKLQHFLQKYYYVQPLTQLSVNNTPNKNKPRLVVLKNDDISRK